MCSLRSPAEVGVTAGPLRLSGSGHLQQTFVHEPLHRLRLQRIPSALRRLPVGAVRQSALEFHKGGGKDGVHHGHLAGGADHHVRKALSLGQDLGPFGNDGPELVFCF